MRFQSWCPSRVPACPGVYVEWRIILVPWADKLWLGPFPSTTAKIGKSVNTENTRPTFQKPCSPCPLSPHLAFRSASDSLDPQAPVLCGALTPKMSSSRDGTSYWQVIFQSKPNPCMTFTHGVTWTGRNLLSPLSRGYWFFPSCSHISPTWIMGYGSQLLI